MSVETLERAEIPRTHQPEPVYAGSISTVYDLWQILPPESPYRQSGILCRGHYPDETDALLAARRSGAGEYQLWDEQGHRVWKLVVGGPGVVGDMDE